MRDGLHAPTGLGTVMVTLFLLSTVMPGGSAQTPESFTLTVDGPTLLTPNGATTFQGNVTLSCLEITEQRGNAVVVLSASDAPATLNVTGDDVVFTAADCPGEGGAVTKRATYTVTDEGTPAFVAFDLVLVVTLGSHAQSATLAGRSVDYAPGQTMDPDGDRTFEVDGPTFDFEVRLEIQANGDTMVMFEDKVVSGTASLTGLRATTFDVDGGMTEATLDITFRAPEDPWTEETVTFRTYSHCLEGTDCGPVNERTITWTFVNTDADNATMTPTGNATTDAMTSEEAPAPGFALGLLAAVSLIGLGRRGRALGRITGERPVT